MKKNRGEKEKTRRGVATTAWASTGVVPESDDRFVWREVENGVALENFNDRKAEEVVVPSEVDGKPVTSIDDDAFVECSSLISLTLPAGLTTIGNGAFYGCRSLSSLKVSEENRFFRSVDGVLFTADGKTLVCYPAAKDGSEYTVPEGVEHIGDFAFMWCDSLKTITFPASVERVGDDAFKECAPELVLRAPAGSFMEKYKFPGSRG